MLEAIFIIIDFKSYIILTTKKNIFKLKIILISKMKL